MICLKMQDSVMSVIAKCFQDLQVNASACRGVGIAVPGNVDPLTGCTRYLPNFAWLEEVPLAQLLKEKLGISEVHMRNDGRCAALAEARFGEGRGARVFSMLTLGTGIGGAVLVNGTLLDGASYDAGDFGHHVMCSGTEAMDCVCGKRGCFETHASAQGLVRHSVRLGGAATTAEEVLVRCRAGDANALRALELYKSDLATGLANLVTFYNPDVIALGGGLSRAPEIYEGLQAAVDARTLPATRGKVSIRAASLGTDAGAIGAALLLMP